MKKYKVIKNCSGELMLSPGGTNKNSTMISSFAIFRILEAIANGEEIPNFREELKDIERKKRNGYNEDKQGALVIYGSQLNQS